VRVDKFNGAISGVGVVRILYELKKALIGTRIQFLTESPKNVCGEAK
jgi:hypothetical protein